MPTVADYGEPVAHHVITVLLWLHLGQKPRFWVAATAMRREPSYAAKPGAHGLGIPSRSLAINTGAEAGAGLGLSGSPQLF